MGQEDAFSVAGQVAHKIQPVRPTEMCAALGHEELVGLKEQEQEQRRALQETEIEIEAEEADAPKTHSRVYTPTPEEFNKHCATHLPYRNWCPICVQAKRKSPGHRSIDGDKKERYIPTISMDYMFMNERTDDHNYPILVIHDSISEGVWAIFVKRKGNYNEYVSKRVAGIINRLGYTKVVIKSDQEPSIKDVSYEAKKRIWKDLAECQEGAKEFCQCQVVMQHSPVGESQANGVIENAIQRVQGQIRAIKLDMESNTGTRLIPSHPTWPWLIEFAAQTLLYWRVTNDDGLTAIQRIRGRSTMSAKPRFGEKVLYNITKPSSLASQSQDGNTQYG